MIYALWAEVDGVSEFILFVIPTINDLFNLFWRIWSLRFFLPFGKISG